ncbi:hypothetical protein B0O80DRAFT_433324 [Mortierella sp. GBAus27b]|nr:hypothetical protein B0O80DRAFT_433324 [Mortierella sp. GBAus27b]
MPAYNGSKMISFDSIMARVYIFDVATLTWAVSPEMSKVSDGACGVSGDQVIFWGGWEDVLKLSNKTYIYNMKTGKWTSRYISPKDTPSTTGLQSPTQHGSSTTTPEPVDASQGLSKNVVNVAIAAGVIVVTALVAFSVYIGYRTRPNPDTESTGTSGSVSDLSNVCGKEQLEESHRFRGQDYPTPPPIGDVTVQTARLQQGSTGARDTQEHPHAIVKGSITGYSS